MANSFNAELMPRIIAGALEVFREEAALALMANKNFENTAGMVGDTVTVSKPVTQTVSDVTPAATPPTPVDNTFNVVQITVDSYKKTLFHFTDREATQYKLGGLLPNQVKEAARALAYKVNADLWSKHTSVFGYAGTAATNPFATNTNPIATLKRVLDDQLCPDGNRILVIGHAEEEAALQNDDLKKMLNAGDANALRQGKVGNLYGFEIRRDIQRPSFTAGTGTGYLINNGGGYAAGVSTVTVDTGAGTIIVGDVVTFAGDTTSDGNLNTYNVTAALAANSFTFNPPLRNAIADNAAVTVKGAGTTYKVNLGFDPAAFGLVMKVPPTSIEGAPTYGEHIVMVDPVTGVPMKLSYLPGYHMAQWELSILYGTKIIDDRRIAKLVG